MRAVTLYQRGGRFARLGVEAIDIVEAGDLAPWYPLQCPFDDPHNIQKADPAGEESMYGNFICRTQYSRCAIPGLQGFAAQVEGREAFVIGTLEGQLGDFGEVETGHRGVDSVGPAQAIGVRISGEPSWASTEPST